MRLGINGFGRIGRALTRRLLADSEHTVVHINDARAGDPEQLRYLLRFDSVYGRFPLSIRAEGDSLVVERGHGSDRITLSDCQKSVDVRWADRGVDVVIEATGSTEKASDFRRYLGDGVDYSVVTSLLPNCDAYSVMGVERHERVPSRGSVISAVTCDVSAAAPIVDALTILGEVERLRIVTLHPVLTYQNSLDGPWPERSGAVNAGNYGLGRSFTSITPKATSLEPGLAQIFPALSGRINCLSYRVPTPVVCYGDLHARFDRRISYDGVRAALARKHPLVRESSESMVSVDYVAEPAAAVVDLRWTKVNAYDVSLVYAYDNEWGYVNRLVDILGHLAQSNSKELEVSSQPDAENEVVLK